jgi:hypothetical protein
LKSRPCGSLEQKQRKEEPGREHDPGWAQASNLTGHVDPPGDPVGASTISEIEHRVNSELRTPAFRMTAPIVRQSRRHRSHPRGGYCLRAPGDSTHGSRRNRLAGGSQRRLRGRIRSLGTPSGP